MPAASWAAESFALSATLTGSVRGTCVSDGIGATNTTESGRTLGPARSSSATDVPPIAMTVIVAAMRQSAQRERDGRIGTTTLAPGLGSALTTRATSTRGVPLITTR